jgi:hypothetical protein
MATAKNRAIDQLRRRQMLDRKHGTIEEDASHGAAPAVPKATNKPAA